MYIRNNNIETVSRFANIKYNYNEISWHRNIVRSFQINLINFIANVCGWLDIVYIKYTL